MIKEKRRRGRGKRGTGRVEAEKRTDLAAEIADGLDGIEADGERTEALGGGSVGVSRLRIVTDAAAERLGREKGDYVTVSTRVLSEYADGELPGLSDLIARELRGLCGSPGGCVLVAGLGNRELTADALGPLTAQRITATRHLRVRDPELLAVSGCREMAVIAPGSAGQTGIETGELIRLICRGIRPSLVVAVDALAARACARLGATVQLSDTGIRPGSGVGSARSELSRRTLGVPVISVGVPTVVNSSVMIRDALEGAGINPEDGRFAGLFGGGGFFVSPKDCDLVTDRAARVIADAIETVFLYK